MLRNQVLKFCGIRPVNGTHFGGVRWTDPEQRQRWLVTTRDLGRKDAAMRRSHRPRRQQSTTVSQDEQPVPRLQAQRVV